MRTGLAGQQQSDHGRVIVMRGNMQWSESILAGNVHVGTFLDHHPRHSHRAVLGRDVKGSEAFLFTSYTDNLCDPAPSLNMFRCQLKTHILGNTDDMYSAH